MTDSPSKGGLQICTTRAFCVLLFSPSYLSPQPTSVDIFIKSSSPLKWGLLVRRAAQMSCIWIHRLWVRLLCVMTKRSLLCQKHMAPVKSWHTHTHTHTGLPLSSGTHRPQLSWGVCVCVCVCRCVGVCVCVCVCVGVCVCVWYFCDVAQGQPVSNISAFCQTLTRRWTNRVETAQRKS